MPQDPRGARRRLVGERAARAHLGGANAWSVIVADPARNLVFVPTSSPSNDYYGGERPGDNLFSDSVVALRADTGERVWHFQTVHHDLWDYDVASPPLLFDWRKDGRTVPAVAVGVEDRPPVHPRSHDRDAADSGGGAARAGQRCAGRSGLADAAVSRPRRAGSRRRDLTADQAWGATDADRQWCRDAMRPLRAEGPFTPPSLTGTLVVPGNVGGMAWGGIAHDRVNDLLIMPVNNLAAEVRLVARDRVDAERQAGRLSGEFEYHPQPATATAWCGGSCWRRGAICRARRRHGARWRRSRPATGEVAWQVPLGQFPGHSARARPGRRADRSRWAVRSPPPAGSIFTAGTLEPAIYAYDVRTGAVLWTGTLPTSARSTPMTYLGRDGRQYVVVAAGGHGTPLGPPIGDSLVAFALPRYAAALTLYRGTSSIVITVCTLFWIVTA